MALPRSFTSKKLVRFTTSTIRAFLGTIMLVPMVVTTSNHTCWLHFGKCPINGKCEWMFACKYTSCVWIPWTPMVVDAIAFGPYVHHLQWKWKNMLGPNGWKHIKPPKIVVTHIIFLQLSFLVMHGHHILDYFCLFQIYLISFRLHLINYFEKFECMEIFVTKQYSS
jgi:hypothetical protein